MKTALYKIVSLFLLMSLCTELVFSYFQPSDKGQILLTEKKDLPEKKADDTGDEKEEAKDKSQPSAIHFNMHKQSILVHHAFLSVYSQAYQSLPEIPPEQC
jgi:hypothetical protein